VKVKQRLLLRYGTAGIVVLAACTWLGVRLLREDEEVLGADGRVTGVTDVRARSIPASAPALRFTPVDLPFRHFPGVRTRLLPEDMGSGVAVEDFDGDGLPDLFFVNAGPLNENRPPSCALFRNRGDFRFERVDTALPALCGMGAAVADYDADGDFDIYVTGYGRNVLLRNEGGFHFTDVTEAAGVGGGGFSAGACWGDADGDGDLDLYVCGYVVFDETTAPAESRRGQHALPATLNPSGFPAAPNRLYLNEGGAFREAAAEWGVANVKGKSLGALFADLDADGVLDLYVANDVTDNAFYRGRRGQPFEDESHASCTADWRGAMGLAVGDPDGDGDLDLFITHWKPEENALYVREAGMVFRDDSIRTYLGPPGRGLVGWACGFADLDLDGRPDVWVVNGSTFEKPDAPTELEPMPLQLFWNGGDRFWDLAPRAGPAFARPVVGRGGAAGDLDGDGDLDLCVVVHGDAPLLLRNDTETGGHGFLVVEPRGSAPNLFAWGATVMVEAGGQRHVQAVGAKVSYLSSGPHALTFGLGKAPAADRVVVRFPSGRTVERTYVPAGMRLVVKEVDGRTLGPQMDAARDALDAGHRDEARRLLEEVVRLDPAHATALYTLAQLVEPKEALQLCLRVLALEPMLPRGHLLRAHLLSDPRQRDLLDLEGALAEIAKARRLNRDETGAALEQGRILLLQGRLEEAAAALALVKQNPKAAALAALCRFRLGDVEGGMALLGRKAHHGPEDVLEEGDTDARRMGAKEPLARLLLLPPAEGWTIEALPGEPFGGATCALADADHDGHPDARSSGRVVLLDGRRPVEVAEVPLPLPSGPRPPPWDPAAALAFALDPPARCAGPPPGATAVAEADADGDGDLDLFVACGGDDPSCALPWWVLLKEGDGYRPVRGAQPVPGFPVAGLAAQDLDGDGRAEVLLKEGSLLPGHRGRLWIASLR